MDAKNIVNYDRSFFNIYSGLSEYMLDNVQQSVAQIIKMSEEFMGDDASRAIHDFQRLYESNSEIDAYKNSINDHVDDLLDYIQSHDSVNNEEEKEILNQLDQGELTASRLSFSALQKDVEALVTLESEIKEKVLPIIHSLKFEEQMASCLKSTECILERAIDLVNQDVKPFDSLKAALELFDLIPGEKGKALFYTAFLTASYDPERTPIAAELSSTFDDIPADLRGIDFLRRVIGYSAATLQWSNHQASIGVDEVLAVLIDVKDKMEFLSELNSENGELIDQLRSINTVERTVEAKNEKRRLIASVLKNKADADGRIDRFVMPIVSTIQFQDRVRQNTENIRKAFDLWLTYRPESKAERESNIDSQLVLLGDSLLSVMTMAEERVIVREHIKDLTLPDVVEGEDDADELF